RGGLGYQRHHPRAGRRLGRGGARQRAERPIQGRSGSLARQLPGDARNTALASVGGAVRVSQQVGGRAGATLADAARHPVTDALGIALIVAAAVALVAAGLIAWIMPRDVVYEEERIAGPRE